jgi:hypothetical protein
MQVMVGLMNIGLGLVLCPNGEFSYQIRQASYFPFWMGSLVRRTSSSSQFYPL